MVFESHPNIDSIVESQNPFTNPKKLLLIDGIGAAVTSIVTGLILTTVVETGLPTTWLYALAAIAAMFACFDLYAYFAAHDAWWPLATIGALNLIYCVITMIICIACASSVTAMATVYFALEMMVVAPLALWELAIARHHRPASGENSPL